MRWSERRVSVAGGLIAAGIIAQIASLYWSHPMAFLAFIFVASPLKLAGILLYLYASLLVPK